MKAIHDVNAVLWQPGELTQNQTNYYTRGRPRAPRVTKGKRKLRNCFAWTYMYMYRGFQ